MFNKINQHRFWISGIVLLILGIVFVGAMLKFSGFNKEKESNKPLHELAEQQYTEGEYRDAANNYEKILILEPNNSSVIINLAIIYDDYLNENDRAIELYKRYLELTPNSKKKILVNEWIKNSAQKSLGTKKNAETSKIKKLEKELESTKKEKELLNNQVQALSSKLYTMQDDFEKLIKEGQVNNEKLSGELTNARLRISKVSKVLSDSEKTKKELLDQLEERIRAETEKAEKIDTIDSDI